MCLSNSGLSGLTFNYVRNSVKVVINAYTGKMTFYVMDPQRSHHRDLEERVPVAVHAGVGDASGAQAIICGTQRTSSPIQTQHVREVPHHQRSAFYNAGDAWSLSESAGAGSPTAALQNTVTTNAQGQTVVGAGRADVAHLPGDADPGSVVSDLQHHGGLRSGLAERQCADAWPDLYLATATMDLTTEN